MRKSNKVNKVAAHHLSRAAKLHEKVKMHHEKAHQALNSEHEKKEVKLIGKLAKMHKKNKK